MQPATTTAVEPRPTRLADYRPPPFLVDTVDLLFDLFDDHAAVTANVVYRRNPQAAAEGCELVLDGEQLELTGLRLDGRPLEADEYQRDETSLRLVPPAERFTLQVETRLAPHQNTSLEGLYRSGQMYCTQMEAQGFRRVTYYPDRPDVMAVFTTTVVADAARYPVLLSNGNLSDAGAAQDGRHFATWHDPHRKPCYLFALVAGDLAVVEDGFTTRSGRDVALRLFVDKGNEDKTAHAMQSLKKAMRWDEQAFGREYDLDVFMIVAVADFNMGAMENKGLNLFNAQAVLANPQTSTDADFHRIEGVVGHEYFHNWSGNRVTCRDWFQLSLKEGFTVYRDQEFSADMGHRAVQRIMDVRDLRANQFAEDAGPLAHPVRPEAFITIDNFYTTTIYEKGAELIRMLATVVGREGFHKGTDLYFERHDGQAVTTEDFVRALEDASGTDLGAFQRWYEQAGTPRVTAAGRHDPQTGCYQLRLSQSLAPTPGQPHKQPAPIPVRLGLVGPDGQDVPLRLEGEEPGAAATTRVLMLDGEHASFRFADVPAGAVPSLLRDFSAPVRLSIELADEQLAFLSTHDPDLFNRWEAGQQLASRALLDAIDTSQAPSFPQAWLTALGRVLEDERLPPAFRAEALQLPDESVLGDLMTVADVDAIHAVRESARQTIATRHREALLATYERLAERPATAGGSWSFAAAGERALKNACLAYLMALPEDPSLELCDQQRRQARNMTDELAALELLAERDNPLRVQALADFRARWQHDALVMNKWFAVQAASSRAQTVDDVVRLAADPAFDMGNPNKVRALYRSFGQNVFRFHASDGRGYALLGDVILELDGRNPILSGRLGTLFNGWKHYDEGRQRLMRRQLERFLGASAVSKNLYEVATKALA